ncbi:nucleotide exchange factor GrpE [Phycicoccus endophyticus]|uniref:Protein GrpE n=2 Tax=Phycicoccus endophyticus TaxID=1690220 RepID=A0A7G9R637_9MICO|nr:nucleotide exchange factor GrpE [Phycicoccus endophyticus]QNN51062.1 nucleotide exchange factor GrpE [Phycicoccus endophyticus]
MEGSVNTEAVNDEPVTAQPPGEEEVAPGQPGATAPAAGETAGAEETADAPQPAESPEAESPEAAAPAEDASSDAVLAAERLADLQRLQAEYVNYKRRVDRDRALVQERAVHDVLESLLGVLDDIHAAREHGDLGEGPFAAIADKLESTLGRYGLSRFGVKGEPFDPQEHEALMHAPWPGEDEELPSDATVTTVVTVLQPGYRAGEQVLRPARVAVADPD